MRLTEKGIEPCCCPRISPCIFDGVPLCLLFPLPTPGASLWHLLHSPAVGTHVYTQVRSEYIKINIQKERKESTNNCHLHFHSPHSHDVIFEDDGHWVSSSYEVGEGERQKERDIGQRLDFCSDIRENSGRDSLLRAQGAGLERLPSSARDQKATVNQTLAILTASCAALL